MLRSRPLAAACFACLAFGAAAAVSRAQGTPIFTEDQKILASDGVADDWYGVSTDVSGNLLIVGAMDVDGPGGE